LRQIQGTRMHEQTGRDQEVLCSSGRQDAGAHEDVQDSQNSRTCFAEHAKQANKIISPWPEWKKKWAEAFASSILGPKCPMCKRRSKTVERRRQHTAYVEEERNFVICCEECFIEVQKYWQDMWEDYYSNCM